MAGYREELEGLRFTPEEKEALAHRLAAGPGEQRKRRMRLPYRALIAAVAAACLLIGAVGAVSLAGVSPAFREWFGITSGAQRDQLGAEQVNLRFEDLNGSGAAIVIKEVVADQEQVYALAEFIPPEGADLSLLEERTPILTGDWEKGGVSGQFYTDQACTNPAAPTGGRLFRALCFAYWTEGLEFVLRISDLNNLPEDGAYCRVDGFCRLLAAQGMESVPVLEGMDFELVIPVISTTHYDFRGRGVVLLDDSVPAVVDDLTLSPISVTFDLLIMGSEAYYGAADEPYSPLEAWVELADGTKVEAEFQCVAISIRGIKESQCRADHIRLSLAYPIDMSQIKDIILDEDCSGFFFEPESFVNDTYWSQVNTVWKES